MVMEKLTSIEQLKPGNKLYAESVTVGNTITTTVINEVTISDVAGNETDVTCYMTYAIDSGFTEGLVEYWNENDDPSTAQPQGHSTFADGETSCKVYSLTPGTTYQFRATIYYGGNVNHVESNVVRARTAEIQYASKYFTVTNTSDTTNTISLRANSSNWLPVVYISTDNGSTWQGKTATTGGTTLATLNPDESVIVKHTGEMGNASSVGYAYCTIPATGNFTVSGNIASLCFGDDFNTGSTLTMPELAYFSLFNSNTYLVSAENLYFGDYTSVGNYGMWNMFYKCTALKTPPDLSNITTVGDSGMSYMFYGCTSLETPPDLSNITSLNGGGMQYMFYGCKALTTPPVLSNIASVGKYSMISMFYGCTSLTTPPDLSKIKTINSEGMRNMFYNCISLTTPPDLSNITSVGNSGMYQMFVSCISLATPPVLSNITSVDTYGMSYMFQSCTSLKTPPDLSSITSVGDYGMSYMFQGCTALETPPDLSNLTSVGEYGICNMFQGCTALKTPPDLSNITSVGDHSMSYMFQGCTSLTTPPDLSNITSVSSNGMQYMFHNCKALTTPPDLSKITSVGNYGMASMFNGCKALTKAYAPTITWDTSKTKNWLNNVAASGTLYADSSIIDSIPTSDVSGCPSGWDMQSL